MYSCWYVHPKSRPLFNVLEQTLYKLLEKNLADHYIIMNDFYVRQSDANTFTTVETDYLSLMASPNYQAPSTPSDTENDNFNVSHVMQPNVAINQPTDIHNPLYGFTGDQNATVWPSISFEIHRNSSENLEMHTIYPSTEM